MTEPLYTNPGLQARTLSSLQRFSPSLRRPCGFALAAAAAMLVCALPGVSRAQDPVQPQASPVDVAPLPAAKPVVKPAIAAPAPGEKPALPTPAEDSAPDRATAYYHAALADSYEDMATNTGRQEYVSRAVEEFKSALNADPNSAELATGLAQLYFRAGRNSEAVSTVKELLKRSPDNIDAHKLLGRIYLRSLGQQDGPGSESTAANQNSNQVLDQAIAEFVKIVALEPNNLEDRLLLGQLYTVKHDTAKAEAQFKAAQKIEPASEDVILNLTRLYSEGGDVKRAVNLLEAVPIDDRTTKEEFALGAAYEQLKNMKDAIAAYQRSYDMEPENLDAAHALAQALLADNQLDAALKQFQELVQADPEDANSLDRIAEIQRRQGKYSEALVTIKKALEKNPDSLEAGYNEGLILDVLGRYDEAVAVYQKMVDLTGHANGAYTQEEKANRGVFLDRLASVYHEENKTAEAIATYQKMIDLGGDIAKGGYRGEVDTYRDVKQFEKATDVCRKAVAAFPEDAEMKLMLATELGENGKLDEGLAIANGLLTGKPADREVYLQISLIQLRLKHYKEAEDALTKAEPFSTKDEDKANLYFQRATLAESEKHYDQAEQFFRKVLEIQPNSAIALNNLGYMLVDKTTRYTDALKYIRKAVELEPTNGAYLDSLGWVYFKLGQYESAEDNMVKAVQHSSNDPSVHDHLGDLYEKTGRIHLAAEQWQISVDEYAKSNTADVEPGDVAKVQKKLEGARVKLAKQDSHMSETKQP
jgi:tetratricopeptide (TPR) repeat protein